MARTVSSRRPTVPRVSEIAKLVKLQKGELLGSKTVTTNLERAEFARPALDLFKASTGQMDPGEQQEAIVDMIANLLHLADAEGLRGTDCLALAELHYYTEVFEG